MSPNVLLINSPTMKTQEVGADNYFPIGLLYLATVLKQNSIPAVVLDINNHFYLKDMNEDLLNDYIENTFCPYIKDYKPDIVGIGCTFSGAFTALKMIAKKVKELFPNVPIVIGGIHPTVFAKEILKKYDFVDYVVIGEGEATFVHIVRYIAGQRSSLDSVDGIAFRSEGTIQWHPKTQFEAHLDTLPFVDYSLLNRNEYKMDTSQWYSPKGIKIGQPFTIISSRSCPNRCAFCSMHLVHGPKIRFRSSENVLDEMERLYKEYGVRYFQFMDDNITFDKERMTNICKGILKRRMDIQFDTPNGLAINRLDRELIDTMVDAGLVCTSLGIESGSDYIRNKVIKKGLSTPKIHEVVQACARHNHLFIKGFFIIGMPQETHQTLQETYSMIRDLPLDKINVNFVCPYPGTELFHYCLTHSLITCNMEEYVDVEVFQDSDAYPHFKPHNLTMDELVEFRQKCFDYLKEKRRQSPLPSNYPLRFPSLKETEVPSCHHH